MSLIKLNIAIANVLKELKEKLMNNPDFFDSEIQELQDVIDSLGKENKTNE